jgi:thiamine-phosphate diphosphorylase
VDGDARRAALFGARLYLLATRALSRGPLEATVAAALEGGVRVVQVREKGAPREEVVAVARGLLPLVRARGALLLVNDDPVAAVEADADGAHVGPEDAAPAEARRILGADRILGVTTHGLAQARVAAAAGADYVGIGPVFPTSTKQVRVRVLGPDAAGAVSRALRIPAFAIGGITPSNARRVAAAGSTRAAVCGSILGAEDPRAAAREILAAIDPGTPLDIEEP